MSRKLIASALALVASASVARADDAPAPSPTAAPEAPATPATPATHAAPAAPTSAAPGATDDDDAIDPGVAERELGVLVGIASGSHVTPGGLRVAGRFLYQLSDTDWFDGVAAFTFGGGDAACYRDRSDRFTCDHAALDGFAGELGAGIRRFVGGRDQFRPWLRLGATVRVARFGADDVTGVALPITAAAGVRLRIADRIALGAEFAVEAGPALFNHGLGYELEAGFALGVLTEIALP